MSVTHTPATPSPSADDPVGARARRRITWRIMPYICLLYVVAYLDRVNVSYAALEMTADLGFTAAAYGLGAGIFFLGYFLLEVPGAVIGAKWGVRRWVSRIMVTWGIMAVGMGFIHNVTQFYWLRFFLGLAEAGFFPAMLVYLGVWFPAKDRGKAVAIFMSAIAIAMAVGGPVSGAMLKLDWLGLAGWRWLFILQGAPAVILGVVTWFYLTDRPSEAKWLPEDEKAWIIAELERDRARVPGHARPVSVFRAMRDPKVLLFSAAWFFGLIASNGLGYWLPILVKSLSGFTNLQVAMLITLPYSLGVVSKLVAGWSSDRTGERRWHTVVLLGAGGVGLAAGALLQNHLALALGCVCVAVGGLTGYTPSFWAYATSFLAGTANAAAIGTINSVGNLGSFVGPYAMGWLREHTTGYTAGLLVLAASSCVAALLVFCAKVPKPHEAAAAGSTPASDPARAPSSATSA